MSTRHNLTPIDVDNLKVGDSVGIAYEISVGWRSYFRNPIIKIGKVTKITPKRTKFYVNDVAFDVRELKQRGYVIDDVAIEVTANAKTFKSLQDNLYKIECFKRNDGLNFYGRLTDEEIAELNNVLSKLCDKYCNGEV